MRWPGRATTAHARARSTRWRRRRLDAVVSLVGLGVVAACAFVARDGTVGPVERGVFRAINHLPDALSPLLRATQLLGVLVVGPLVALVAFASGRRRLAFAALLVTAGKLVAERVVWELVSRARPGTTIPDAIVRGGTPTTGAAFVSGHVVLVSALAWIVTPYLRGRWRGVPWVVAGAVAFSRVYLGAHAPLDAIGGAALGLGIGAATNLVVGVPAEGVRR